MYHELHLCLLIVHAIFHQDEYQFPRITIGCDTFARSIILTDGIFFTNVSAPTIFLKAKLTVSTASFRKE